MKAVVVAIILGLGPIAALAKDASPRVLTKEDANKMASLGGTKEKAARATLKTLSKQQLSAALSEKLSDVTAIVYQRGYGVYIEYTAADGRDRMWFPGNTGVVSGIWGVREIRNGPRACFHYFNSVDAVTGEFESTECIAPVKTLSESDVIDRRSGDVFNLLSGRIPYRKDMFSIPAWPDAK